MPIPHEEYKVAYVTSITDQGWWGVQAYVNAGTSFFVFFFFFFFFFFKISASTGTTPCTPWRCPCLQDRRSQSVLHSACGEKPASFGVFHCKIMIGFCFYLQTIPMTTLCSLIPCNRSTLSFIGRPLWRSCATEVGIDDYFTEEQFLVPARAKCISVFYTASRDPRNCVCRNSVAWGMSR